MRIFFSAIVALLLAPAAARSQPEESKPETTGPEPTRQALSLSASPDAPTMLLGALRGPRGKVAALLPFINRPDRRFFLHLLPLIELSNESGSGVLIPNQAWRGRFVLRGGMRFGDVRRRVSVALALEHESAHHTEQGTWILFGERTPSPAHDPAAIVYNDLALRSVAAGRFGSLFAFAALRLAWHVLTCTVPGRDCDVGVFGGAGGEIGGELGMRFPLGRARPLRPLLFASLEASLLRGQADSIAPEQRVSLRAGAAFPTRRSGLWSLSLRLLLGHDVGVFGHDDPGIHPGLTAEYAF